MVSLESKLALMLIALSIIDCGITYHIYGLSTSVNTGAGMELNSFIASMLAHPFLFWWIKIAGISLVALFLASKKEVLLLGINNVLYLTVVLWGLLSLWSL